MSHLAGLSVGGWRSLVAGFEAIGMDETSQWQPISALAAARGVSKQAILKSLKRLKKLGVDVPSRREGHRLLIDIRSYDAAIAETTVAAKAQAVRTARALKGTTTEFAPSDGTLLEAQTRKMAFEADLKGLDLAERCHALVPIDGPGGVAEAMASAGARIARALTGLENKADALLVAARGGPAGARTFLKAIGRDLREQIAKALREQEAEGLARAARGIEVEVRLPGELDAA
jgi:biotin operon repressor